LGPVIVCAYILSSEKIMTGYRTALVIFAAVTFYAACQEDTGDEEPINEENEEELLVSSEQLRGIHGHMDKDKDGKISMTEALNYAAEMHKIITSKEGDGYLESLDADKDGKVSLEELKKSRTSGEDDELAHEVEEAQFKAADADKDGFLSVEEFHSFLSPEIHEGVLEVTVKHTMANKDKDGDNQLSLQEWFEYDPEHTSDDDKEEFRKMDTDGNGFLNLEEVKVWESGLFHRKEWLKEVFNIADKDKDMHLSADEIEEAREKIDSEAHHNLMEWAQHHEL